jgi:hypothetical protein
VTEATNESQPTKTPTPAGFQHRTNEVIADVMKNLGSTVYTTQADVVVLDFGGHLEFVGAK